MNSSKEIKAFEHLMEILDTHLKLADETEEVHLLQAIERALLRALLERCDV